ncbi:hypothetical protein [Ureibacillus aquaedulcis]|uniref:Uncharacterized protein n=1 Tax=Ureibacillus aquaedulcis TaxID=3058421 RepID=A0ABT8GT97_9BACL|nr:hypothetical protein [Ureibacillus sp. BA0131]MDN4494643.1 hypothetical protein [Ureibacillus sp. BA0131]
MIRGFVSIHPDLSHHLAYLEEEYELGKNDEENNYKPLFTSFQYHIIRLIDLVNGHIAMKVKNVLKSNINDKD